MVQFHPEELVAFHEASHRLFAAFVDACRARMRLKATSLR
jgi:gamma-glutamyl-gamma-aminobutyrate hydrolase PuuD